ncbi:MAG TPA: hypothetical protein VHI93_01520 [Candidatus Thermoplasmatota archaeon]|nr:hypothetical protein [Candidatus Thermoplasmatota archaeon]
MRLPPLALLAALLLAGCLSSSPPAAPAGCASTLDEPGLRILPPTADPIDDERGNATAFPSTNVRTCSLPAIGWAALQASGVPHRYLGEMDLRGDLGLGAVAVVGAGEAAGAYVVDIRDRARPQPLAFLPQPGGYVTDVKFSDDGKVLYVASQQLPSPEGVLSAPELKPQTGFTAYSLADPARPAYLGAVADPSVGCHMLEPVQVSATEDAVFCASQHLRSHLVQRGGAALVNLGFVDYVPTRGSVPTPAEPIPTGDPTCPYPSQVPAAPLPGCVLASGVHDMTAFHTGGRFGNGTSYLVVSHWDEGLKVLDITQAPAIHEAGAWKGEGATHYAGNVHTAAMFEAGGHRYILASPEYTAASDPVPSLWLLDADDLASLRLVAEWWHPGNHPSQGLYLTTHQWQVAPTGPGVAPAEARIYLTYNHAGVWVLDLGKVLAGDNAGAILGYNLARRPLPEGHVPNAVLATWDVGVVDGYVYGTDRATGLWVFHHRGDALGDKRLNGFV